MILAISPASSRAFRVCTGGNEADDLTKKLSEPFSEIVERMRALEATIVAGLQAKAKMLFHGYWEEHHQYRDPPFTPAAFQ